MRADDLDLNDDLFELAGEEKNAMDVSKVKHSSYWKDSWVRFRKNKGALAGLVLIVVIMTLALFGPMMNSHGFDEQNLSHANLPPKVPVLESVTWLGMSGVDVRGVDQYEAKDVTSYYWFGTDELGRDIWTRIW